MGHQRPDTVVVGAGTTGCVVAARLVELAHQRVLLVEAGPEAAPAAPARGHTDLSRTWDLQGLLPEGGCIPLPLGRAVGGTSVLHGGIALRGFAADYAAWSATAGNGWSYDAVLEGFRSLEHDADFDDAWHGRGGPVRIQRPTPDELQPVHLRFLEACQGLGVPWTPDFNAPSGEGVGLAPLARSEGRRIDVLRSHLARVRRHPRLTLRAGTTARRLLLRGSRVVGVELLDGGNRVQRVAAGQIVVCGGAVGSPALLLRSGIGPPDVLRRLGITPRHALPAVGQGLRDHPTVWIEVGISRVPGRLGVPWWQVLLRQTRSGELPDHAIELFHDFRLAPSPLACRRAVMTCSLLAPRATGQVRLRPGNPDGAPVVDLGYGDPGDLRDLGRVVGVGAALLETDALAGCGPRRPRLLTIAAHQAQTARRLPRSLPWTAVRPLLPAPNGSSAPGPPAADDLGGILRRCVVSAHHLHGSCRMGLADDPGAVVDSTFRVRGLDGLAVADASVVPVPFRANTHLVCVLLGEQAARQLVTARDD